MIMVDAVEVEAPLSLRENLINQSNPSPFVSDPTLIPPHQLAHTHHKGQITA